MNSSIEYLLSRKKRNMPLKDSKKIKKILNENTESKQ